MENILKLISERRSIVSFSEKLVEPDKITLLFEAARWAPSSSNIQPWRFIYATRDNAQDFEILFNCLAEGNQKWVKHVPLLVLSVAETISSYKNLHNRFSLHDVGLATSMLMIQARALDLYTHPMGGFDAEKAKKNLDIPYPYEPVAMIAIGYKSEKKYLPEEIMKRDTQPRIRKPLSEIVFRGKFKLL
jgi:nitroreductase